MATLPVKQDPLWQGYVQKQLNHIRSAYLAAASLEELIQDAQAVFDQWKEKDGLNLGGELGRQAKEEFAAAQVILASYQDTYKVISDQMGQIKVCLSNLQDQRLTLEALSLAGSITELGADVLEKVYEAVKPDSQVDQSLALARQAVNNLSDEAKARQELQDFLA